MTNNQPDFDTSKPALVLLYGDCNKKHKLLDRDVIVVGRARGCDFHLDAPDISSIHLIISRGNNGYRVRDCHSRAGTKLNGNAVKESPVKDGDLLQIGPFSFRLHLPARLSFLQMHTEQARWEHLQRSRRKLGEMAIRHRKRLHSQGNVELEKQRQELQQEVAAFRLQVQQAEQDSARTRNTAEAEILKSLEEKEWQVQQRERDLEALTANCSTANSNYSFGWRHWRRSRSKCKLSKRSWLAASQPSNSTYKPSNATARSSP